MAAARYIVLPASVCNVVKHATQCNRQVCPATHRVAVASIVREANQTRSALGERIDAVYSPQLGRFLSQDPYLAGQPDILYDNNWFGDRLTRMRNLYGYCDNNPSNATDPSGLGWIDIEVPELDYNCFVCCLQQMKPPPGPPGITIACGNACITCGFLPIPENPACITCSLCSLSAVTLALSCVNYFTNYKTINKW
jgi:RHS repeat-associated protein